MNEQEYHANVGMTFDVGALYWALPTFDCDDDTGFVNIVQPARFMGYDQHGNSRWWWLNTEIEDWPARWTGSKIEPPASSTTKEPNNA